MSNTVMDALQHLVTHGWIPLRSMSPLLGYTHPTGVYGRQRGKNPVPTILVGSTYRVYEANVVETLKGVPEQDKGAANTILSLYRNMQKQEKKNA